MNTIKSNCNIYTRFTTLLLVLVGLLMLPKLYAEGSKDIYPTVTEGGRAYLRASTSTSVAFPFPNLGTHFVYAEAGEQIAIATNAQSGQTGDDARIRLYHPNGTSISLNITLNNGTYVDT